MLNKINILSFKMMTKTVQISTLSIYRFIALLKSLSKSDLVNKFALIDSFSLAWH